MTKDDGRIRSLDGLRAVSIILVMISHLVGVRGFAVPEAAGRVFELGELGVRVFFVISGFLITSILLRELAEHNSVNLVRFYFRRTLRIFPPYYLFVLVLAFVQAIGLIGLNAGDLSHALSYSSNYHPQRSWFVGHTWSLAVEEQFYILWPATLLLIGKRKGLMLALAVIVMAPLVRVMIWEDLPGIRDGIGQRFETVADSIAAGCLLAGLRGRLHRVSAYQRFLNSKAIVIAVAMVLAGNAVHNHPLPHFFLGYTVMNLGIAFCIDWCVTNNSGRIGKILNCRPAVTIGVMSYSIYLWQQVFLNRYSESALSAFPANVALVSIAATTSYVLCEKPCFGLRKLIESRIFKERLSPGAGQPRARAAASAISSETVAAVPSTLPLSQRICDE